MPEFTIPEDVHTLAARLAEPKPMRRGSVSERYVKCNKPGCPCAEDPAARHGPYFSISRVVKGKTGSRWLDAEQAKTVRRQVETGQQFRKQVDAYWEACERWADRQLEAPDAASDEAAKMGAQRLPRGRSRRGNQRARRRTGRPVGHRSDQSGRAKKSDVHRSSRRRSPL